MKYIYAFYQEKAKFFTKPTVSDVAPDQSLTDFKRSVALNAEEYAKNGITSFSLFFLGVFNDETGEFDQSQKMQLISSKEISAILTDALVEVEGLDKGVLPDGN